ncbi:TonB-dependent receptor [Lentisalinibacter salinarum]|uniref:TonB-dependent receptor n=1 Tax=Lentisalinibacter salinarum TaxID=2992239 RepID=UPI003870A675
MRIPLAASLAALAVAVSPAAWPDTSSSHGAVAETALEEIVVYGRSRELIGTADTASEGLVGYDDIQLPPLLRVGELVEAVPGMVATQHSGSGKANQYFLRGFNLDHGTDFSVSAGGVPLNMPTHGHGQGYLDLNFLIPELVATTRYRKGPYAAETGDFSSAGSVEFTFYDELPETLAGLTAGEHGYGRALAAGSSDVGGGTLTAAFDATVYDGPWELEENLEQYKAYLAYAFDVAGARAELNLQAYDSEWDATDQIPLRAVESGLIDRLGFLDPDLGGQTGRYALTGSLDFGTWEARAYVVDYDFTLYSNFTYFLDDPAQGDEFEQRDDRTLYGASLEGGRSVDFGRRLVEFRYGADLRYDDIDEVGLYGTAARVRTDVVRQDAVEELAAGVWGEADVELSRSVRAILGLRADYYDWQVVAFRAVNSGSGDDSLVSPKLGLAWRMSDALEAYASWGRGFHSNDVRGATIVIDPASGDLVDPVDVLVESEGGEVGLRFERGTRFNATLVGFWLELDSELVYVGDAGTTEPNDATERLGVEASAFWQANEWLAVNAAWTATDAEFKRDQGGGREIPGAVDSTFTLGLNAAWANGFSASARVRYLDDAPLVEDGSVRSEDSLLLNAGVAWRRGTVELRLDAFNLLDSEDDDIAYFYESRLAGESAPVGDLHFHPLEPRTVRASVTMHWR